MFYGYVLTDKHGNKRFFKGRESLAEYIIKESNRAYKDSYGMNHDDLISNARIELCAYEEEF